MFPPLTQLQVPIKDGLRDVYIDSSLDAQLEACIVNYQDGIAGEETLESLRHILSKLRQVRMIISDATYMKNGSFYVVDKGNADLSLENIIPKDYM